MGIIEADSYRETREKLRQDPHIQRMAEELILAGTPLSEMCHDSGTPRFEFMGSALKEYKDRHLHGAPDPTQPVPTHIGGPAEVIIELVKKGGDV